MIAYAVVMVHCEHYSDKQCPSLGAKYVAYHESSKGKLYITFDAVASAPPPSGWSIKNFALCCPLHGKGTAG